MTCFNLTTNFDILMKSKIILSVLFWIFFPSENIAAETFYRLLELAPTVFLGRSVVCKVFSPSFLLFIGVTLSSVLH